ncbi:MAG: hypothetical protein A3G41_03575 [Elusimicrobia bacterium RIFCSPLOWO2_12_FULL_59_9]|nr:MAG: hypothetical protein A3G41_03575 [Elusimicrobia bacterium RIFCSPLOWO2_12_FULL_59_9]
MALRPAHGMVDEIDPRVAKFGHAAPMWLFPYADLMTEMVCFFIILFALSSALNKDLQEGAKEIHAMLEEQKIQGEVKLDREGLKISLEEQGEVEFFGSGHAELTPHMIKLMEGIAPVLKKMVQKNDIVVEGHTDDRPIRTANFASNWELSTARATNVVRYLLYQQGFPPAKLAAVGYGEFRPLVPNDTPENRAKNRRVKFWIKN